MEYENQTYYFASTDHIGTIARVDMDTYFHASSLDKVMFQKQAGRKFFSVILC